MSRILALILLIIFSTASIYVLYQGVILPILQPLLRKKQPS
ncbi:MAG: hypothetical protein ACYCX4_13840 [Bacillota bacterium]